MSSVECLWPVRAILGEGPVYLARENAVYFVDIKKPALHRFSLSDGARMSWGMPEPIGWVIPRRNTPGFIAGFKTSIAALALDPVRIDPIVSPEPERANNRRNDAKADAAGRIWAGSMDDGETEATGALYRLDPDFTCTRMDDGYRVCNGPTFSPDGRVLYHTDSARRVIFQFDLAEDGTLSNKRDFVRFREDWGFPDGMTTDADGGIWVAHWDGARVSRFAPDGGLDRSISLPVSRVTSCVFAGEDLRRMFVTTASIGRESENIAGGLFEIDPGVAGAPAHLFAG